MLLKPAIWCLSTHKNVSAVSPSKAVSGMTSMLLLWSSKRASDVRSVNGLSCVKRKSLL